MATVLLIGPDGKDQENLASTLQVHGHTIQVTGYGLRSPIDWKARLSPVDLVILDVTPFNNDIWRLLRKICQQSREDGMPTPVLCRSTVYRGPRFELDIERLGARFVYER